MMEQIPHAISNQILPLKCSFRIGYGIGHKYLPIWVSVSVSDQNHNSGFGRTLILYEIILLKWVFNWVLCKNMFTQAAAFLTTVVNRSPRIHFGEENMVLKMIESEARQATV